MRKDNQRWELVSFNGSTKFIAIETSTFLPDNAYQVLIRFIQGHSFLSGYPDAILFDGLMDIELKAIRKGLSEMTNEEVLEKFVQKIREVLPGKIEWWNPKSNILELRMMEDCQTSVEQSSRSILERLATALQMQSNQLTDYAIWELKRY